MAVAGAGARPYSPPGRLGGFRGGLAALLCSPLGLCLLVSLQLAQLGALTLLLSNADSSSTASALRSLP